VCDDGSIFVDRDGEHFGHVIEYMRDGVVSVADLGARPSVSLLRLLKREFRFYCIEPVADEPAEPAELEVAFVMGGYSTGETSMERYDAASDQWSSVATTGRTRFGACALLGEVYVTGEMYEGELLSSLEKYSSSSDTWSIVVDLPEPRAAHAVVAVGSAMYVLGGRGSRVDSASVVKYDSVRDDWSQIAPMPEGRSHFAACAIGSDIFVFGGHNTQSRLQASVFKYDTVANAWSTLAPMPREYHGHSASVLDGQVYIVGAGEEFRGVLRFDPGSGVWSTLTPTSMHRNEGVSFVLGGCLYAAGGEGQLSSVERYNAASNTWVVVADMLAGRDCFGVATTGSSGPAQDQDHFLSLIAKAAGR
jgi:hypothetical protein